MEEPKLNEEELKGLSEEERAKKIAEIEKQKELYWKERYKQTFYEFGDAEPDYSVVTPDVAEADKRIKKIIAQIKENEKKQR